MVDLAKLAFTDIYRLDGPAEERRRRDLQRAAANGGEGWIYHQDEAKRLRASSLSIAADTRTLITIDGLGADSTDELDSIPREGQTPLLSGGKFMPVEQNDNYLVRFGFMAAITSTTTQQNNYVQIEYDIGGLFNVHEAATVFVPDPGPLRREKQNLDSISLGFTLIPSSLTAQISLVDTQLTDATNFHANTGQKFIEFGQAFAGAPVVSNGVAFYVTPTTDIELWGADILITRLSSPTI